MVTEFTGYSETPLVFFNKSPTCFSPAELLSSSFQ